MEKNLAEKDSFEWNRKLILQIGKLYSKNFG